LNITTQELFGIKTITFPFTSDIDAISVSEVTSKILVLSDNEIYFINRNTSATRFSINQNPLKIKGLDGRRAQSIVCSPVDDVAYVLGDSAIYLININEMRVTQIVPTGINRIAQMAISPDGEKIYLTGEYIYVFSTRDKLIKKQFGDSDFGYAGVAFSPDGKRAYANGMGKITAPLDGGHLAIIDAQSDTIVDKITKNLSGDGFLAVTYDSQKVYMLKADEILGEPIYVDVLDATTDQLITPIEIPGGGLAITASSVSPNVYISTEANTDIPGKIYQINSANYEIVTREITGREGVFTLSVDSYEILYVAKGSTLEISTRVA